MVKVRVRRLWLQVLFDVPDKSIPRTAIVDTLIDSINRGDYKYPRGWRVAIRWRNKQFADWRTGEFTAEMTASRESSPGFDTAVISYLESQR